MRSSRKSSRSLDRQGPNRTNATRQTPSGRGSGTDGCFRAMRLGVLYRGPLSSCNYDCSYCPFAKRMETAAELATDRASLARFVARVKELDAFQWRVFFTPWGEALTRSWYRESLASLSRTPHVLRAAIQTNLSVPPRWLE